MKRDNYGDLLAFIAVARQRSFTKAASQLGISQSALSHAVKRLEARLDVPLLTRSTRSVTPTDAGAHLLASVVPRLDEVDHQLDSLGTFRGEIAGVVRITTTEYALGSIIWPRLAPLLARHRHLNVEALAEDRLIDIVAERFDIGVRFGDEVPKDMVAMRLAPDVRMTIVGSPSYFAQRGTPQQPNDLDEHDCIHLWLASFGGTYAWELTRGKRTHTVRGRSRLTFTGVGSILEAAVAGFGLAFLPEDMVQEHVRRGRLIGVMPAWCPRWEGLHAYYPSRRDPSAAVRAVLKALRGPRQTPELLATGD